MKTKLIAMLMLAASGAFAGPRVFFGVNFGVPVAPAPVVVAAAPAPVVYATPCPGPGYLWVNGYYTYVGGRPLWRAGYWRATVYGRAFVGHGYYRGYRR
ncbi:MAG TPA: YXWGXW repeat-containing protein [Bryobacteraceae bacterium]|nr:YXWGXW repeat-containing protein [Bryobacteraceae bacterium]